MLPKANRLKKKKDFEAVSKQGSSFKNSFLILKVAGNTLIENRFGFVISQKVSKKAVIRNKLRRRLASIIKKMHVLEGGKDFVFIGLAGLEKKDFVELENIVKILFTKIKS